MRKNRPIQGGLVSTRSSRDLLGLSHQKNLFFKVKPIYENIDTFKQYEAVKFSENCIRQVEFFFCDAKSSIFRFLCPSSKSSFNALDFHTT